MNPLVSIIVPLYNQERYLDACLRSISRQSYKNLEVIVVNDGSTDNSSSMAKEWSKKDQRIRVVDKCNEGAMKARLFGYELANGDYVAFVDSDDLLPKDSISILTNHIEGKKVDLVIGSITKKLGFYPKSHIDRGFTFPLNQVVSQPELFDKYYLGFFKNDIFPVSMCARLYRKSIIDRAFCETNLYDEDITLMGEDQFFNVKLFPYLRSLYRTDETVYIYRFGGGTTFFNPHFPQLFSSSDKRLKLLDQYNYTAGYRYLYNEYIACLFFHASRLIRCQVEDKAGVIDFFRHEMNHRELMPRLIAYYIENGSNDKRVQVLLNQDFEGMYNCAMSILGKRQRSLKMKLRNLAIKMLVR